MRELKSRGCVTLCRTENRLSCMTCMDNFSMADLLFYNLGEKGNQIISHIRRGIRISYTSLHLTHVNCYTDFTICPCVYEPCV